MNVFRQAARASSNLVACRRNHAYPSGYSSSTITIVDMLRESTSRLLTALRLALYPAFESAGTRRFQALTMEAENARGSGDLAKAELLYSVAVAETQTSHDACRLSLARYGLAQVYQEQRRYREAESIFQDQLEEATKSPQPNTLVHAGHMSLARLYEDEGKFAEAEIHYKAALAETGKTEVVPERGFWCSTSMWLAKFYIARQRYIEAEPLFQRASEILEKEQHPNSYLPHHLEEFAKLYEAQGKDEPAEVLYRRALALCEEFQGPNSLHTARAAEGLAAFCRARCRHPEAEELYRRSLTIVEEHVRSRAAAWTKAGDHGERNESFRFGLVSIRFPLARHSTTSRPSTSTNKNMKSRSLFADVPLKSRNARGASGTRHF